MRAGKKFGFKFLLILIFWGVIAGFIVGYLAEIGLDHLDYPVIEPYAGAPLGAGIGFVMALLAYLTCRRALFDYITDLREELAAIGELPFGIDEDLNLSDQASAFYGLFEYEVSKLAEYRDRLNELSDQSKRVIEEAGRRDMSPLRRYLELLDEKLDKVAAVDRDLESIQTWIQDEILPVSQVDFDPLELEQMEEFEGMIDFQQDLEKTLQEAERRVKEAKNVVLPWGEGPGKIREGIEQANQLLLDMSELFREFPSETLPEQAETLRQHTQRWDRLAEKIEDGYKSLVNTLNDSHTALQAFSRQASSSTPPPSVWKNLKDELSAVDNKINRLRELTGDNWTVSLRSHVDDLRDQIYWIKEALHELREETKSEVDTVSALDGLAAELDKFLSAGEK